jgi:hypothetical protein
MTFNQRKEIVDRTNQVFRGNEWYRGCAVDPHPTTGEMTIFFRVNYEPLFEKKRIIDYTANFNLPYRFIKIDKNGKPVE